MQKSSNDATYPYKLFFYDCIWEENKIIYPASNCNAICETDIITGKTIIIGNADEEKEYLLFHGIYKWENCLILSSINARAALHLFDLETEEWSYITIDESRKNWLNFRQENVFEHNGYIYIFPSSLVVLKVDIKKRSIEYLFYPDIRPDGDVRGEIMLLENVIYIPIRHKNKIYKFNLSTEQWEILAVNTELKGIDTLCFDGKLFWMTGIGRMVCAWDEKKNLSLTYKNFPQKFNKLVDRKGEEGFWFNSSFIFGNSIFLIPCDANMVIEFDIRNCEANELFIEDEWEEEEDTRTGRFSAIKYMGAKKKDNILMMLSNKNKNLIFIDMDTKMINKVEIKLCIKNEVDKLILGKSIVYEGLIDLKVWLGYVSACAQQGIFENGSQKSTMGKNIYSIVK